MLDRIIGPRSAPGETHAPPIPGLVPGPRAVTRRGALGVMGATAVGAAFASPASASTPGRYIVVDAAGHGDYASLEVAVAAAPPESTIEVRPGLYPVSTGNMNPAEGVTVRGSGYSTHVRAVNGLNHAIFQVANDNVVIESLRVDGNGPNQVNRSTNCVQFSGVGFGKVLNCYVHDAAGYNIVGFPGSHHLVISGNHSYSTQPRNVEYPRETIELHGGLYCTITANIVDSAGANGILLWNADGDCGYNTVAGNVARNCGEAGIGLSDGAHDNTVTGNSLVGNLWGILSVSQGGWGSPAYNAIVGNAVANSHRNGIQLQNPVGFTVTGNMVRLSGLNGIYVTDGDGCTIGDNNCSWNHSAGLRIEDSSDVACNGNIAMANGLSGTIADYEHSGILIVQISNPCRNIIVSGNRCYDPRGKPSQTYGIILEGSPDWVALSGNLVNGNGATTAGLAVSSTATNVSAVPTHPVAAKVGTSAIAVAHGLGYAPRAVSITMTSPGSIWVAKPATGTALWLQADAPNRTAQVRVG